MKEKSWQQKIAIPDEKYNEIKEFSDRTGIPMSKILMTLWDKFKKTKEYEQLREFSIR